jgi:hypothetical protein
MELSTWFYEHSTSLSEQSTWFWEQSTSLREHSTLFWEHSKSLITFVCDRLLQLRPAVISNAPALMDDAQLVRPVRPLTETSDKNNNNHDNKHAYAGTTDNLTPLRVLLVLTDRGIVTI